MQTVELTLEERRFFAYGLITALRASHLSTDSVRLTRSVCTKMGLERELDEITKAFNTMDLTEAVKHAGGGTASPTKDTGEMPS
jgi:hypothetical protein